jgi:HD-GYP domain-containing protein (c-di-GMP phosphodiesterase class II)
MPPADEVGDELVRTARVRVAGRRLERIRRRAFALSGGAVAIAALATALTVHAGPPANAADVVILGVLYALVSRVAFETGSGYAVPTQLVLVPMLFALPLGLVPAVVGLAFVAGYAPESWASREPARVLPPFASAAHAFGPVLVLAVAGGLPLRWSAWPVYLGALAAQFAFDFANAVAGELGNGTSPRAIFRFVRVAYAVDAALAPIGLAVAFATRSQPALVALVLPLVLLLRHFARERQRRIDHALELSDAYRGTVFLLGDVVEADDAYTGSHSRHVVDLVLGVCDRIGLRGTDRRDAEFVALLHDVGKIRIPAAIIGKPGPLDPDERALMETHTIEGQRLLEQVGGLLGEVGRVVRSCHERWDGAGYPDRLAGEQIPLVARIVCACDAYSAMTTDRPYRAARSDEEALAELHRCAGTQFDPAVVEALAAIV